MLIDISYTHDCENEKKKERRKKKRLKSKIIYKNIFSLFSGKIILNGREGLISVEDALKNVFSSLDLQIWV